MCGIIGITAPDGHVQQALYDGLMVLQHRGQDAAGIVTCDDERLFQRKANGLVKDVFRQRHMERLPGRTGIGHVRYPTAGSSSSAEAQPFYTNSPYGIALAHNGNLTNSKQILPTLYEQDRRHVNTNSDSEILLNVFASELFQSEGVQIENKHYLDIENIFDAVTKVHGRVEGSYAVVVLIAGYGLLAFRDPFGIRPLVHGVRTSDDGPQHMFASESVALTSLGFDIVRDLLPGEAILVDIAGNLHQRQCHPNPNLTPCIFEHVYFARPDSIIDGTSVHEARLKLGTMLAERIMHLKPDHEIDAVIAVPDSGRIAAIEVARTLDVPYREGFVKNRYVGRTFLMPGQAIREDSVRKKLNVIPSEFKDKTILIVDDSIVRGNTSRKIVEMARDVGAAKVYFASSAPQVIHPNVYGIDMPARAEYIAHGRTIEEIQIEIGADWLVYQTIDDLIESVSAAGGNRIEKYDCSCFDGKYICGTISDQYLDELEGNRNDAAKQRFDEGDETLEIHNEP
jgi:amidophosphoribosyltransferase